MKRLLVIVALVLLGGALVFLNQGVRRSALPDRDEDEQAQQAAATAAPKSDTAPTDLKGVLPPEETVGNPADAAHHIEVGWVYDEANQQKPETLNVPLQAIRDYINHSGGVAAAEIVNLDVPAEDRTPAAQAVTALGIRVDGKPLVTGNVSELPFAPNEMNRKIEDTYPK